MLAYIPVRFDLYRPLKAHLRWTLQCLVGFADRAGRCFPSVRKLAEVTGHGKSTVSRHLAALERDGTITRTRKPGGVYAYQIDRRFLPAARGVSHHREKGVPPVRTEENPIKKTGAYDWEGVNGQWRARVDGWRRSGGKFWLPAWGPRPNELGCLAPAAMLLSHI
jgi:DNA-binding transcriptional ArsR family regulator